MILAATFENLHPCIQLGIFALIFGSIVVALSFGVSAIRDRRRINKAED